MSKTNVYMDWTDVVVTPTGGSNLTAVQLTKTVEMAVNITDIQEKWQPSGAKFAKVIVDATGERTVQIRGGDCFKLRAIPHGVPCTITGKLNDAKNRAGEGAILLTATNAYKSSNSIGGSARKFAMGDVGFECIAPDGVTDPIVLTEAPAPSN